MTLIEPLPTPPTDGVPIAAVQHVIHADPPLSCSAVGVFMCCASYAWELAAPRTVKDLIAWRPAEHDEIEIAIEELEDRGLVVVDGQTGAMRCTTGVPGSDPR